MADTLTLEGIRAAAAALDAPPAVAAVLIHPDDYERLRTRAIGRIAFAYIDLPLVVSPLAERGKPKPLTRAMLDALGPVTPPPLAR